MNNDCVWIGIGINIKSGDEGYEEFIKLNNDLVQNYGSTFVFDAETNQPHINLYDLDIPKANLGNIESELQEIASQFNPFSVQLNNTTFFDHGTIFVACELNSELKRLEEKVVKNIVDFKGSCRTEDYSQPWRKYTEEQILNREKYGNPYVLNTFTPHITVGFVKTKPVELQTVSLDVNEKFSFEKLYCDHLDLVVHGNLGELTYSKRFALKS